MGTVKRNIVWLLLAQAATFGVSVIVLLVVPGELGPSTLGELAFAVAYATFFVLAMMFGAGPFITKMIARGPDQIGRYVFNSLILKVVQSLIIASAAMVLAVALGFDQQRLALIAISLAVGGLEALNQILVGGLAGLQRMGRPAFWNVLRAYLTAFLSIAVLRSTGEVVLYAVVPLFVNLIPVGGNLWALRHELAPSRHRIEYALWREVLRGGWPFFVMAGLTQIYGSIDIPMVSFFSGSEVVGWYSLAYQWTSLPIAFSAVIAAAAFPALAAESVTLSARFLDMADRAIRIVIFVSVPIAVGTALVADEIIELIYGGEFQGAVPVMRLLALAVPIVGLDIVLGMLAIAVDRQRQWVRFSLIAAIANPALNLWMIPLTEQRYGNGAIGAAFSTVVTECLLMFGGLSIRPRGTFTRPSQQLALRVVVSAGLMVPAVMLVESEPVVVQVIVGALVYSGASLALRTIPFDEIRRLRPT